MAFKLQISQDFNGLRTLGRPRHRWEDNIKMDLQEVGCGGMDWIELAQDKGQLAGTCKCGNKPSASIKCWEFLDYLRNGYLLKKDPNAWSK